MLTSGISSFRSALRMMALVILGISIVLPQAAAQELPLISEIAEPDKKGEGKATGEEENKDAFPRKLSIEEANLEPGKILPPNPLFYFESPNSLIAFQGIDKTSIAKFIEDTKVKTFFRVNPLTLNELFSDLPSAYSNRESISLLLAAERISRKFIRSPRKVALSAYATNRESLAMVFLSDIGRDRKEPYETLGNAIEEFIADFPEFGLTVSSHEDDFLDTLSSEDGKSRLAVGIVKNYLIVCTDATFARDLFQRAKAGTASTALEATESYRDLAVHTDSTAHIRGFIDLPLMLQEASRKNFPGATEMLDFASDISGRKTIYYDLRSKNKRFIEHVVSPTDTGDMVPGLPKRISQVCRPAEVVRETTWTTPKLIPYQPDFFVAGHFHPTEFVQLLEAPQPFGGSEYMMQISVNLPQSVKEVIIQTMGLDAGKIFSGEAAMALLPGKSEESEWLFVFALADADMAASLLATRAEATKSGGVKIYSLSENIDESQSWAIFSHKQFQNLQRSYLIISKTGETMRSLIDQTTAISASLADNRDFKEQTTAIGKGYSVLWYYNVSAKIAREYIQLAKIAKEFFPRISGLNSRPPMGTVTKTFFGMAGGVNFNEGEKYCRTTITSPFGAVSSMSGMLVLNMPRWIRERSRVYLSRSRTNLGKVWLELQTFATQRGHFPESIEELKSLFPRQLQESLFTCTAAVAEVGQKEAQRHSYSYIRGLRTTDEPDMPIIYESSPWHYEYSGMFPVQGKEPQEEGVYQRWRLVLYIDGTIKACDEKEFQRHILPRIRARE